MEGTPEYEALYNKAIQYFPDQLITRTGWIESDLADDRTENMRFSGSLHYFINERTEAIAQSSYAQGTSVYTAQNRFATREFNILSGKLELNNPNYNIRAYGVTENSGNHSILEAPPFALTKNGNHPNNGSLNILKHIRKPHFLLEI